MTTYVSVNFSVIIPQNYEDVVNYYNTHKDKSWSPLQKLNRAEGGFEIAIPENSDKNIDANKQIKQVRWNKKSLVTDIYKGYIPFEEKETELLYNSMVSVFGKEKVVLNSPKK